MYSPLYYSSSNHLYVYKVHILLLDFLYFIKPLRLYIEQSFLFLLYLFFYVLLSLSHWNICANKVIGASNIILFRPTNHNSASSILAIIYSASMCFTFFNAANSISYAKCFILSSNLVSNASPESLRDCLSEEILPILTWNKFEVISSSIL